MAGHPLNGRPGDAKATLGRPYLPTATANE
jgi:hypothetical protein